MTRILIFTILSFLGNGFGDIQAMESVAKPKLDYKIRKGKLDDREGLKQLYKKVAATPGGLARTVEEITDAYIAKALESGVKNGIMFVADLHGKVIGSIIKYKLEPAVFSHVLTDGSILVDPEYQRKGIGEALITSLQNEVKNHHPEIYRVEIIARESNPAIKGLYARTGFVKEGEFKGRIKGVNGKLESDIPMAWYNPNYKCE